MTWLTWRQLRVQALAVYAGIALAAIYLLLSGRRLLVLVRTGDVFDHLTSADRALYVAGLLLVAIVPALIGAFWGAPLVARELEAGTHRLAWTQTVTRTRWLLTKLGMTALAAAAAVGTLSWAVSRWAAPLDGAMGSRQGSLPARLTPVAFAMRGIVPVGYVVFAVVLGATLGVMFRRVLAAMALTLVVFTAVQVAVPVWLRPHLAPPVTRVLTFSSGTLDGIESDGRDKPLKITLATGGRGDWMLSDRTVNAAGRPAALPAWLSTCLPPIGPVPVSSDGSSAAPTSRPTQQDCFARLDAEGYRQQLVYQPSSQFWRLQLTETALFLAVSGLLAGVCLWWTRRRLA